MAQYDETHATFTIERALEVKPAIVFGAWSDPAQKRLWFACHDDWVSEEYSLDCRVGGHETSRVRDTNGVLHAYRARILDVIANRRLIFSYDMYLDDRRISISLATVGFLPATERLARESPMGTTERLARESPMGTTERLARESPLGPDAGTKLIFTEQVIFLDGYEDGGSRRHGTEIGLDKLGLFLHAFPGGTGSA